MKKFFLISLVLLFYCFQAYSEERYCYVQIASSRDYRVIEELFNKLKLDYPSYILKFGNVYTIRVGGFKNYKSCKFQKKVISDKLRKYRIKPIIFIGHYATPPENYIVKEKRNRKRKKKQNLVEKNISDNKYLYIKKAEVCMGKKDCKNAIKYLKLALEKDKEDPKIYTYLGYAYMHIENYESALSSFKKALEVDPRYAEAYAGIGLLYLKLKAPKAAVIAFKKAYELNPREMSYGLNLAISLLESGNVDKATVLFQNLKEKYPFLSEIYYNEALCYLKKKNYRKAIEDFEIFLDLTKDYKSYQSYRAEVSKIIIQLRRILREKNGH